jgi:biopolymer transport protein ExbB/TolQ
MAFEIEAALITAIVGLIGVITTYLFTNYKDRQSDLRKIKTERYDDLLIASYKFGS